MRARAAELAAVAGVAALVTAAIAAPVLLAPSSRLFGMDIAGRHHDPFTVMQQIAGPLTLSAYSQPITDLAGVALARAAGPIAACNGLVLISFPLSAAAAYALARYLALSRAAAWIAALAYAFAPFHLAQAAYHPHIAQTQWMPLYLLALWLCMDTGTPAAIGGLIAATAAVTLSNFYGGLIAGVLTPVAIVAHWHVRTRAGAGSVRGLAATVLTLGAMAGAGLALAWWSGSAVLRNPAAFAFPRADLFRYSATWWSYLLPPVAHPLLGQAARGAWDAAGVREGILEQQVSLGWGVMALAVVAGVAYFARDRAAGASTRVPVLAAVAAAAFVCSLSPDLTLGSVTVARPSGMLYAVLPMFRSYARFGGVVQLMAALLAGVGIDVLRAAGSRTALRACGALVVLAAAEYAVAPSAMWRDVLPTRAHRWVMQQTDAPHVLDCTPPDAESASVPWLTGSRVTLLDAGAGDCSDANVAAGLAAEGYTHLLVRQGNRSGRAFLDRPAPAGLRLAARFRDAQVFAVTVPPPLVHTAAMAGFWPREYDADRTWRWMRPDAAWTIVNHDGAPITVALDLELSSFQQARRLDLALDGRALPSLLVAVERRVYRVAPFTMTPGRHQLTFRAAGPEPARRAVSVGGDPRVLSCALGSWTWIVPGPPS